ncbi:cyanophycinase [Lyngbya confervoides]|uniref:Cyanophycinase n=1 Tax=Lyngbya confervoides BDU141951 TaxID=1574623 RepID=A0ABD4SYB5_9CYAN|nr:cyanophycinase [Lyngbya confervoides]MCM1981429.1 cyanophycinase [Lyngbya confervoides BDU141951]
MAVSKALGQLVIIGGAEDKQGDCDILRAFVRRAGGTQARLVVMTVATSLPEEVGEEYRRIFQRLGVEQIDILDTAERDEAEHPEAMDLIEASTGIFFTGGDQARITEVLKGTQLEQLLHQRYEAGAVIAGTSAGAAMMPDVMILEGEGETHPRFEVVSMSEGMGFLPGVVIDQHFAERGRLGRLLSAVVQQPVVLGFGIDEDTAIAVSGNEIEVLGSGSVTVIDVANLSHDNSSQTLRDEPLALCDVRLHILPAGYRFDLNTRRPLFDADPPTVEPPAAKAPPVLKAVAS